MRLARKRELWMKKREKILRKKWRSHIGKTPLSFSRYRDFTKFKGLRSNLFTIREAASSMRRI